MSARAIEKAGSDAQKDALLPAIGRGELIVTPAWLEPDNGFGAAGVQLRAQGTADGYRLSGVKRHVFHAKAAQKLLVLARTGDAPEAIDLLLSLARDEPGPLAREALSALASVGGGDALYGRAKAVAEAFPNSFLGLMLDAPEKVPVRRSNRSDRYFVQLTRDGTLLRLLEHCLPGRRPAVDLATITNHDDRAAFVCALTALGLVAGAFVAVGDGDGWIVLPPAPFIRPRQWALLAANSAESPDALHVAGGVPHGPV